MFARTVRPRGVFIWSLLLWGVPLPLACGAAEYVVKPLWSNGIRGPAYGKLDGLVIFRGSDPNLYATDGSTVHRIPIPGVEDPDPETLRLRQFAGPKLETFKGALYFVADGPVGQGPLARTLYKTDGRAVSHVAPDVSGIWDYDVRLLPFATATDDFLYFERNTDEQLSHEGVSLYKTDGTSVVSAEIGDQGSTGFLTSFQGDAILYSSGPEGGPLFREDDGGRTEIAFDEPIIWPGYPTVFQGDLMFTAHDDRYPSLSGGRRLMRTDGTSIAQVEFPHLAQRIDSLTVAGDRLYFKADVHSMLFERIWHTDGNTVEMLDFEREAQNETRFVGTIGNDLYLFDGYRKIFRANGGSVSEVAVDFGLPDIGGVSVQAALGDALLVNIGLLERGVPFSGTNGLFFLEGDTATFLDIGHGSGYSARDVTVFGEDVFFTAEGEEGRELFKLSDDVVTEFEINPAGSAAPEILGVIDDALYFSATGPTGTELYWTDGDSLNLIDINPDGDSNPTIFEHIGETLLVWADAERGRELFSISPATHSGDYDGNGLIEQADLDLVLSHWGRTDVPEEWVRSRPSGLIDQEELDRVLDSWGSRVVGSPVLGGAAAVPEPGTAALLVAMLLVGIGGLRRVNVRG
jgi:hypothetical protein